MKNDLRGAPEYSSSRAFFPQLYVVGSLFLSTKRRLSEKGSRALGGGSESGRAGGRKRNN